VSRQQPDKINKAYGGWWRRAVLMNFVGCPAHGRSKDGVDGLRSAMTTGSQQRTDLFDFDRS
jgi:hypothetical protein